MSRYSVTEKAREISIQVSSSTAVRIRAKEVPGGTLLTFKAGCTHSGLAVILILILFGYGIPIALAMALIGIYRSAWFASNRVIPRLSLPPLLETLDEKAKTRAILIDSLSEGRRLSTEAHEAAKSNYQDAIIVMVTMSVIAAFVLVMIISFFSWQAAFVAGFILSVLFSVISWRYLARRTRPRLLELQNWRTKLDLALNREIASQSPPDGELSSFEIVVESIKELPGWLKILEKSGLYREPVQWIAILFVSMMAVELAFFGLIVLQAHTLEGGLIIAGAALILLLPWALYRSLKRRYESESKEIIGGLSGRLETVRSEMEKYLGGV